MKDDGSSSWVSMVKKLLRTYNLPSAYSLLENTPNNRQWKKTLHGAVWNHWEKEFKEEANTMSTMEFLNVDACQVGKLHPVWKNTVSQLDILKATVKAQLLIKRYPLSTSRTAGKKWSDTCPLCGSEPETTAHFLLRYSKLSNIRQQYLPKVMSCYEQPCYGTFCRPCTICRWRQIVPTLAAHFVAPMHNLTPGDKMCRSGTYGFGATKCAV